MNENEEYCCMFRTRLGQNSVLYGAEMDGLEVTDRITEAFRQGNFEKLDLNKETFVELKTSR